jgi:archaellum biogenesis ATPase FlaH
VDPTELSLVSLKISRFVEERDKTVVLIEGAEYLITQNDFETVLRFVNHLHDFVLAHDCAIVVVIDPRVLSTREVALLERSAKVVEPMEAGPEEPSREPASTEA